MIIAIVAAASCSAPPDAPPVAEKTLKAEGADDGKGGGSNNANKIPADMKKTAEEKISALKAVKDSDNVEDVKAKTKDLSETMQKIGAELYKQQPQPGATPPTPENEINPESEDEKKPKAEEGEVKEKK